MFILGKKRIRDISTPIEKEKSEIEKKWKSENKKSEKEKKWKEKKWKSKKEKKWEREKLKN